jgi:hypothetical protein
MKPILLVVGALLPLSFVSGGVPLADSAPWGLYSARQDGCEVASCSTGCTVNGVGGHTAPAGGNLNGEGHVGCYAGINCGTMHGTCGGDETFVPSLGAQRAAVLAGLMNRAAAGDGVAAKEMYLRFSRIVSYNLVRGALQVEGCKKGIFVASIPLTASQQLAVLGD